MPVPIYAPCEIDAIEQAARAVCDAIDAGLARCAPGATTLDVNAAAEAVLRERGAEPLFIDHRDGADPFRFACCVCVNDEVVNARPGGRVLKTGDLVTLDAGARLDGWCADLARTVAVGEAGHDLSVAAEAVADAAVRAVAPGVRWSVVARAARDRATELGVHLIDGYAGHGIGRTLHEPPPARIGPADLPPDEDFTLRPGMVLTIEPIVCARPVGTVLAEDRWLVRSRDGSPACYTERMIAVTKDAARVLG